MKKSLLLGLFGLAATTLSTFAQGTIVLDNYNTSGPFVAVTYGQAGIPANGVSGTAGTQGSGLLGNPTGTSPWTAGLYYVLGNVTIGADPNPTPIGDPSTFSGGLVVGPGSTAGINDVHTPGFPGEFLATQDFAVPGTAAGGGNVVTMELVAYSGSTYDNSNYRGHSSAFQITTTANTLLQAAQVGNANITLAVYIVPEPSVLALSGIGAAALMIIRRRK